MNSVEYCRFNGALHAIIVRSSFNDPGITFFTDAASSQQLAAMSHPVGKIIAPHRHNGVPREVHQMQEVLVIQEGKLQVDFYTESEEYLESRILFAGDTIMLCDGAHGFRVLEPLKMIEIKQGPYPGEGQTTRFSEVPDSDVRIGGPTS